MENNNLNTAMVSLLIPTLNAGSLWPQVLESIGAQSQPIHQKIIIDSGSDDDTIKLAQEHGFKVISIDKKEFNHGRTRQMLADAAGDTNICIFLTQDAILAAQDSLFNLVQAFDDISVGIAYGRQLPHKNAKPLETHARLFNYPDISNKRGLSDKERLGFKVFFCSNSFAAYRLTALKAIGGFPVDSIMGEDAIVAAKMLLKGYKVAYVAEAAAHHSHSYTAKEEYKRYFDTRVFHEQNKWLIDNFGKPTGEGIKFVKSELKYVMGHDPKSVFKSITSIFAKWLGYKSGKYYKKIPAKLLGKFSMHSYYWK